MLQVQSVKPHYKLGVDGYLYRGGVFVGPVRNGNYKIWYGTDRRMAELLYPQRLLWNMR